MKLDATDRAIINALQDGFPVSERPYREAAARLGLEESELLIRLQTLLDEKVLTRFGPMFHAERMGGGLTLVAMSVPEADFERVAELVNGYPEVAHNYQREHRFNMWFVLATETPQRMGEVLNDIETRSGYKVYNMPKEKEFFVGLKLAV